MASNIFDITCPVDCDSTGIFVFVETINPDCPPAPARAEITEILLMHPTQGVGPVNWTAAPDWATAIDNADVTDTKVKRFAVSGAIGEPARPEVEMTNFKIIKGEGMYVLEVTIKSLPDGIRAFFKKMQCGNINPVLWYVDAGGFMYGKNEGINTLDIDVHFPHDLGRDAYTTGVIRISWEAQTDPERITSPI